MMRLDLTFNADVSYVQYQNDMDVLLAAKATNDDEHRDYVLFKMTSSPGFFADAECRCESVGPYDTVDLLSLPDFKLKLDPDFISSITEAMVCRVEFTASDANGNEIGRCETDVKIQPFNYWSGISMPETIASFVTPNAESIASIRSKASDILGQWGKPRSLEGYQSDDRDRVLTIAAAVYAALERDNINYINPPAGFEKAGQRIRLPDEVLSGHEGTCIDLAILYAAALESIGLNTLIFVVNGHAFAGFWLVDDFGTEIINWDYSVYTRRYRNNEIRAVECTCFTNTSNVPFDDACKAALQRLEDSDRFICAIDIAKSRAAIKPLPVVRSPTGSLVIDRDERRQATTAPKSLGTVYDPMDDKPLTRVDRWKRELLDTTNRNNLINMKQGSKVMPLLAKDISDFEDELADGGEYTIYSKPQEWGGTSLYNEKPFETENYMGNFEEVFEAELARKRIRTPLTDTDLERTLRSVYRLWNKEMEESGCNSLFVSLGVLRWYEGKSTGTARYAPLILVPVELKKKQKTYAIKKIDEETVFNVTLAEKLRQDFEINLPNMDPLPADESGVDVEMILQEVRRNISGREGWDVLHGASLGVFSFSQFAMWKDLDNNIEKFEDNPVVKSLVQGIPYPAEKDLDTDADPYGLCLTVSADGSQIKAVRAAGEGRTFVMHGPPGTGKSQTITNIITNALNQDKTVLFVAEKRAALEVVQKRLEEVGIGNHCLELHSNKTEKSRVIEQLRRSLDRCPPLDDDEIRSILERIGNVKGKLDEYVLELHKKRSFGMSAYDAISRYESHNVPGSKRIRIDYHNSRIKPVESRLTDVEESIRNANQAFSFVKDVDFGIMQHVRKASTLPSVTMDTENIIGELRSGSGAYSESLSELRGLGLPIDVMDDDARRRFFESMESIDARTAGESDLQSIETGLKAISGNVHTIMDDLRSYANLGFNVNTSDVNRTLSVAVDTQSKIAEALSSGYLDRIPALDRMLDDVRRYCTTILGHEFDLSEVAKHWKPDVFRFDSTYNVAQGYAAVGKAGLFGKGKAKKEFMGRVGSVLKNPGEEFEALAVSAGIVSRIGPDLLAVGSFPAEYAENRDVMAGLDMMRERSRMAAKAKSIMGEYGIPPGQLAKYHKMVLQAKNLIERIESQKASWDSLVRKLSEHLDIDLDLSDPSACMKFCDGLEAQMPRLFDWTTWNYYADRVTSYGMKFVLDEIRAGMDIELLIHSAYRSIYEEYIMIVRGESETLRIFSSSTFEEFVKKFRELDKMNTQLSRNMLKYKLSMRVPKNLDNSVPGTETHILYKAINSSKIRKSIRTLLSEIPNLLPRLCPCFLMSPQSVSQYITLDYPQFDLVIFDESSQITTSKAIGSLGRAKNAVIAGDSKQLPPTSFFQKKIEADDDDDQIDVDSFLDDCLSLSMPETYLEWHYRSRHESLITFSNRMFYDSKMLTFPSPNDLETKVGMRYVKGVYEKKKRINQIEAQAIVDEVYRRVMDDRLVKQSMGIIAFSISQQTCIQDMLDDLIKRDSRFFDRLSMMPEDMFIKNLETVQGDERDVILFSIGYGPDSTGYVYQNFGPINRDGGQRRLNVAVSRARYEMIVFTSMKYTDINITSSSKSGVRSMREFLRFAENCGRFQEDSPTERRADATQILIDIAKSLKEHGYESHFNVGTSQFKVDIAIVNPANPAEYILGILSDGDSYKTSENTRDREYARADVLKNLGWNLMHVWSIEWYFNKQRVLERILLALKAYRSNFGIKVEEVTEIDPNLGLKDEPEEDSYLETDIIRNESSNAIPYTPMIIMPVEGISPDTATSNRSFIESTAHPIIEAESPINEDYLVKLYCKKVGIKRLSEQKRSVLIPHLRSVFKPEIRGKYVTYWEGGTPKSIITYRVSDDPKSNRNIDCVPLIEIENAIVDAVRTSGSVSKENAAKAASQMLGYKRNGANLVETLNEIIDNLLVEGKIVEKNGKIVLGRLNTRIGLRG